MAHANTGMLDSAIAEMNIAISFTPTSSQLYLSRSTIYFKLDDKKRALRDVLKANEIKINNWQIQLQELRK